MPEPLAIRLYAAVLRLYPPAYRRQVGRDAVATFARLYDEAASIATRRRVVARGFGGALRGLVLTWGDAIRDRRRHRTKGGVGMGGKSVAARLRRLVREPGFSLSIVALIAVGIGSTTAIISVVDTVLLTPLPYPEPDRLVFLENGGHSVPDVRAWRERLRTFEEVAGARPGEATLMGTDVTARAMAVRVTEGFLAGWGATPALGRLLEGEDYAAQARVAVISHPFWTAALGGEPGVVGSTVSLDGVSYEVVGVLSESFPTPVRIVGDRADVWLPILEADGLLVDPASRSVSAYGRLRPGVSVDQAQADMDRLMADLEAELPEYHRDEDGARLQVPITPLARSIAEPVRVPLLVLLGASALLLLATCANAAGLFLARGVARRGEWSVRMALGAPVREVVGDVALEATALTGVGATLGLGLAAGALDAMVTLQPGLLPRASEIGIGARTVLQSAGLALGTGLVFAIVPALHAMRASAAEAMRSSRSGGGVGELRLQSGLVCAQVGLTTLLLLGGGLVTRSLLELTSIDLGIRIDDAIYVSVPLGRETPRDERVRIVRALEQSIGSIPGVEAVGGGMTSPLQFTGAGRCCWGVEPVVDGVTHPFSMANPVTPGYFDALGIELVAGRTLEERDIGVSPVPVVVNETMATELFGTSEAVGRSLDLRTGAPELTGAIVVGVAPDVLHWGATEPAGAYLYLPWASNGSWASRFGMAIRVSRRDGTTVEAVREAAALAVPSLALDILPYAALAGETAARPRFFAILIGIFAVAALVIAAGGLFATLLYHVRQRRRDVGIRLALGADGSRVAGQVLRRGLSTVLIGAVLGGALLPLATRPLEALLFRVDRGDPRTVLAVVAILLVTTVVATYVPARLAARTDPVTVLRED